MNKINITYEELTLPKLYERFSSDIFKYSFSILKHYEEAQDAVQEVFVKFAESEHSFKKECSQKTWLLIIARSYCYNKIKSKSFNCERIEDNTFTPSYTIDYETKMTIRDALLQLSEEHNELIYLKDYSGYSYKEISEITKLSVENVKIKLFRARMQLKKYLTDEL